MLTCNVSNAASFLPEDWLTSRLAGLEEGRAKLESGSGAGGDFTGWVHQMCIRDRASSSGVQRYTSFPSITWGRPALGLAISGTEA